MSMAQILSKVKVVAACQCCRNKTIQGQSDMFTIVYICFIFQPEEQEKCGSGFLGAWALAPRTTCRGPIRWKEHLNPQSPMRWHFETPLEGWVRGFRFKFMRIPVVCNLWGIISLWGSCRVRIDNGSPPTKGKHTLKRPFLFSKTGCAACFAVFGASWYFGYSPTSW